MQPAFERRYAQRTLLSPALPLPFLSRTLPSLPVGRRHAIFAINSFLHVAKAGRAFVMRLLVSVCKNALGALTRGSRRVARTSYGRHTLLQ